jgi:hypothetical protein
VGGLGSECASGSGSLAMLLNDAMVCFERGVFVGIGLACAYSKVNKNGLEVHLDLNK